MTKDPDDTLDQLWKEYSNLFQDFDDLTLARWMSQTLGQIQGRIIRYSHPIVGAYRMAALIANERHLWLKRMVSLPSQYSEAPCCRAPVLPLFTRDLLESGIICEHCNDTLTNIDDLPEPLAKLCREWGESYGKHHEVAHWTEQKRADAIDYDSIIKNSASACAALLKQARITIFPLLVEEYPTLLWEDQDECLNVRPEDILD